MFFFQYVCVCRLYTCIFRIRMRQAFPDWFEFICIRLRVLIVTVESALGHFEYILSGKRAWPFAFRLAVYRGPCLRSHFEVCVIHNCEVFVHFKFSLNSFVSGRWSWWQSRDSEIYTILAVSYHTCTPIRNANEIRTGNVLSWICRRILSDFSMPNLVPPLRCERRCGRDMRCTAFCTESRPNRRV
jgi:hypothetical protein